MGEFFPYFNNTYIPKNKYDHNPIILEFNSDPYHKININPKDKPKRFEKLWMENPKIDDIISKSWKTTYNSDPKNKLHCTLDALWGWGKRKFGNLAREINKLTRTLKHI